MSSRRPQKTLADYVVVAISPLLIMALVGSLVFFLLEVVYRGPHAGRLRWVLFWFVFATVLIARIAIEQGKSAARVYAVAFWAAVILVILRFVPEQAVIALPLLAVAWWSTNRLTTDCTLIDDSQDASGEGLMQAAGLEEFGVRNAECGVPEDSGDPDAESGTPPSSDTPHSALRTPHSPGLWVVYFSLAALPLFGLGQVFIPASDSAARAFAFRMLWVYVAAGIGLLLTTSFLGLRRYLRQRRLTMPVSVTGTWLGVGTALAVGVLVAALLLPRPDAAYSMNALVDRASEEIGRAAKWALGGDDAGEGEGRPAGRAEAHAEGGGKRSDQAEQSENADGGDASGSAEDSGAKSNDDGQSSSSDGERQNGERQQDGQGTSQSNGDQSQQNQSQQEQSGSAQQQQQAESRSSEGQPQERSETPGEPPTPSEHPWSSAPGWIATLFKWIIYGLLAVAVLVALFIYREQVLRFLIAVWTDLRNLLAALLGLFRGRTKERPAAASSESAPAARPVRPFASYRNPFASGQARSMPPEELVRYTFAAFEAWGSEAGRARGGDQTALEYAVRLGQLHAPLAGAARDLGQLYTRTAYSSQPLPADTPERLANLWQALETLPPRATAG